MMGSPSGSHMGGAQKEWMKLVSIYRLVSVEAERSISIDSLYPAVLWCPGVVNSLGVGDRPALRTFKVVTVWVAGTVCARQANHGLCWCLGVPWGSFVLRNQCTWGRRHATCLLTLLQILQMANEPLGGVGSCAIPRILLGVLDSVMLGKILMVWFGLKEIFMAHFSQDNSNGSLRHLKQHSR